jgi:hypothetical protein
VAEDVCDLSFAEAGSVVLEGNLEFGFVDLETAEAIGVGKFTERTELIVCKRGLEFEFGFEECHGGIIAKRGCGERRRRVEKESGCSSRPSKRDSSTVWRGTLISRAPLGFARGKRKSRAVPFEMTDDSWRCGW